jgi:hypothetical protein
MEVDYSSACGETISKCKEMSKNEARFNEALEMLLQLEKQVRKVSIVGGILCSLFLYNPLAYRIRYDGICLRFGRHRSNHLRRRKVELAE